MLRRFLVGSLVLAALCVTWRAGAQSAPSPFSERAAFAASSEALQTIDFESVAPARGFGKYRPAEGLTVGGVTFRASGGARFGPGLIYVVSAHYGGGNPMLNTGTLPLLGWAAPNQPGNATLDVTLPANTTAVGADLWTQQPYASTVEVTATTSDGLTQTVVVSTRNRPSAAFVGFISDRPIVSVSFRPPKGQTGLLLDNFTFGRRSRDARPQPAASAERPGANERTSANTNQNARQETADGTTRTPTPPTSPPSPSTSPRVNAPDSRANAAPANPVTSNRQANEVERGPSVPSAAARGTIAYVRGGTEIRLIEPDGSNDRRLWTHQYAKEGSAIHDLAWRPDGKELAFSSAHLNVASLYHADLYAVGPDGKGFRKITNAPDHGELARYPKGAVQVTVRNEQPIWRQSRASAGVFFVYVVGADEPQAVTLPPGSSKTLLFKSVADFGDHAQPVVAMYGQYRWFIPGVDVRAGRTITAPAFGISGDGYELFGAFRPVWRSDGSRVSFRNGLCLVNTVPAVPTPGALVFQSLFGGEHPSGACTWDWGPTPALADQILYTSNDGEGGSVIHRLKEGGTHPGTKLHVFSDVGLQLLSDLRWLPDGSGFLYAFPDLAYEFGNLYRYDLASKRVTQLTNFEGEYARAFSISPDGAWVVFERAKSVRDDNGVDLWVMRTDGTNLRLLVRNGLAPSWGR
ncbi:MAG TPA: hypothetical protein VER08_03140 [Pyrinomonadaceae bacterium]|nr:hypothetical protein [Pyrinomonadaceae bacterium]